MQLEGGITNRNFRVNFGGTDYVVRLPGKKTNALGIDREAERMPPRRRRGSTSRRPLRRCSRTLPASSPASSPAGSRALRN